MTKLSKWTIAIVTPLAASLLLAVGLFGGGQREGPGTVHDQPVPAEVIDARADLQRAAGAGDTQILFGDLHVHTTFSADAFMRSLPLAGGEGAHPPADACDYARFCSGLDFFSLTDHAESLSPEHWQETIESARQCSAVAGDPTDPDLVVYAGWEWSQVGTTPEDHYGHKNVIFRDLGADQLPARPIGAGGAVRSAFTLPRAADGSVLTTLMVPISDFAHRDRYLDLMLYMRENARAAPCPVGVDSRELPVDCKESARTPQELFEKLGQWGLDALVIPHGTTWGFYTPPGYTWDKQLTAAQDDQERQRLIEVFSGHGNSEEYRPWRGVTYDGSGAPVCPEPTADYEPCCWRAGEIIRSRCNGGPSDECERRVREARRNYLEAGVGGHLTVPGATVADWKDCGQCRSCFDPAFNFRPGGAVQYVLAKGGFADGDEPRHATLGLIASSDNHSARPGTGYKDYARRQMTDTTGGINATWRERFYFKPQPAAAESQRFTREELLSRPGYQVVDLERQASFFMTGGLVAVHSAGRSREAIWEALKRREVYGTSGDRILLWFDLLNGPSGELPMGSAVSLAGTPRFRARAVGAFAQEPGCPAWSATAVPADRLARLCLGECYHPSDRRRLITRIEVIRIRPQANPDEPLSELIEDVWRRFDCPPEPAGCTVEFEDPDFAGDGRKTVYYIRAVQEATDAIGAGGLRCERDSDGNCIRANPCFGDFRTDFGDDCLAPTEERAWSSPIFLSRGGGQ